MQDNQIQTSWAYIAGIMDADGCFMVITHRRQTKNGVTARALSFPKTLDHWSMSYLPCVKIAMIEPEAINLICDEMGFGKYNLESARPSRPNSKPIYHWYIRDKDRIMPFIQGIMPYLRVKKPRAEHLLAFCKHLQSYENPCYKGLPPEELDYRQDMCLKMRKLNGSKVGAETKPHECENTSDSPTS